MSDFKTAWKTTWTQLKTWRVTEGLPVLPPLAAIVELAALVVLILVVDWAFPSVGFSTLEPSPFWVPVLLLSLQYGTVAGLLAAATATAAYVFNGVAEQAVGENFFSYLLRIWALPILWIGVALVLGQFRLRQIAVKQGLRQDLAKRTGEAQRLAAYAHDLEARCRRLERQLTTRTAAPVKPVLDAMSAMAAPHADIGVTLDAISNTLWPGTQVSMFEVSENGCTLIAHSGWPDTASWSTEIASTHPLYRAIAGERRAVTILNRGDESVMAGHGVAAQPVLAADGRHVAGMLKIEMIDPAFLDAQSPAHLALLAELLSGSLFPRAAIAETASKDKSESGVAAWLKHSWKSNGSANPANDAAGGENNAARGAHAGMQVSSSRSLWPRRSS